MPSLSRVQPCGSRFERFLDTCLSAATRLWAIPCRFSPPLSAPSDSPATWPLLRRAPVGRHGSSDRVLAKILRWGVSNVNPLSNTSPTITDPTPVTNSNPLSNTPATLEVLMELGFSSSSGEGRQPIDEQLNRSTTASLRLLAASFGTPTPVQNKDRFLLSKPITKARAPCPRDDFLGGPRVDLRPRAGRSAR